MAEWRLFGDTVPECTTPEWYAEREAAPHLEQEGQRERLLMTAALMRIEGLDHEGICDLGAGDGGLLSLLAEGTTTIHWGYDLQPSNVEAAKNRGVIVELASFLADTGVLSSRIDLAHTVVASEVLEHLIDPHCLLRELHAEREIQWLVASSPYTETAEHHYEHHVWAWDMEGYRAMIEAAGWHVVRHETAWISQIVVAKRSA